ncbi:hypothetical protein BKA70DRAFT_1075027, partial [Coprinopsis sp. MPI-PUGE-AT-0042]
IAARLPPELLGSIFQHVLPEDMDAVGRIQFQQLRMVCSLWRDLCFTTPHLWASLTLIPSHPTPNSYADLMKGWFLRAGDSTPLSLTVD